MHCSDAIVMVSSLHHDSNLKAIGPHMPACAEPVNVGCSEVGRRGHSRSHSPARFRRRVYPDPPRKPVSMSPPSRKQSRPPSPTRKRAAKTSPQRSSRSPRSRPAHSPAANRSGAFRGHPRKSGRGSERDKTGDLGAPGEDGRKPDGGRGKEDTKGSVPSHDRPASSAASDQQQDRIKGTSTMPRDDMTKQDGRSGASALELHPGLSPRPSSHQPPDSIVGGMGTGTGEKAANVPQIAAPAAAAVAAALPPEPAVALMKSAQGRGLMDCSRHRISNYRKGNPQLPSRRWGHTEGGRSSLVHHRLPCCQPTTRSLKTLLMWRLWGGLLQVQRTPLPPVVLVTHPGRSVQLQPSTSRWDASPSRVPWSLGSSSRTPRMPPLHQPQSLSPTTVRACHSTAFSKGSWGLDRLWIHRLHCPCCSRTQPNLWLPVVMRRVLAPGCLMGYSRHPLIHCLQASTPPLPTRGGRAQRGDGYGQPWQGRPRMAGSGPPCLLNGPPAEHPQRHTLIRLRPGLQSRLLASCNLPR